MKAIAGKLRRKRTADAALGGGEGERATSPSDLVASVIFNGSSGSAMRCACTRSATQVEQSRRMRSNANETRKHIVELAAGNRGGEAALASEVLDAFI